jgi:hypothetical protein
LPTPPRSFVVEPGVATLLEDPMIEDVELLQVAALLVQDYGDEAAKEAMNRVAESADQRDEDTAALWRRIARSASALLAADRAAESDTIH